MTMNKRGNNEIDVSTLPEPVGKGQEKIVVNNITMRSVDRNRKDIQDWKSAMITAESVYYPNRTRLYDVYSDVLIDGHLTGLIAKRFDSVLNKGIHFEDAKGLNVDAMDKLIGHPNFRKLMKGLLETILWGISGLEFIPGKKFEFNPIPRKHIKAKLGIVSFEQNGREGFNYLDEPNLWILGEPTDLGLLLKCAPYAILKRGALGDWAEFIEIFGRPVRIIRYDAQDKQAKVELKGVFDGSGGELALLIPKTADFEMLDGKTSNANGELQSKFYGALNNELSVCMLGNTETTGNENGGSNAKTKTQQEQQQEITKSDMKYLLGLLNSEKCSKILQSYGYPVNDGKFTFEKEINIEILSKQVVIVQQAKNMGLPVSDDFLYDLTGIDKPNDYAALKKEKKEEESNIKKETKEPKKEKPIDSEDLANNIWDRMKLKLGGFFPKAPAATTGATPHSCGNHLSASTINNDFNYDALIERIYNDKSVNFDAQLFDYYSKILLSGFKKGWNKGYKNFPNLDLNIGFAYGTDDPAMLTSFESNLFRFSGTKSLAQVQEMNQLFRQSKSFNEFKQRAQSIIGKDKGHLATEYHTAVSIGESAALFHSLKKDANVFPYWRFKTSEDDKVRISHDKLDNLTLPQDDIRWNNIFPPIAWNCRCYVEPLTLGDVEDIDFDIEKKRADEYLASKDFDLMKNQGFGVNRAVLGEAFTQNQFYTRKFPGKAKKVLDNLNFNDYDLRPASKIKSALALPIYEESANAFFKGFENKDNNAILTDYKDRKISIEKKNRVGKTELLNTMKDTLSTPDEVWLNDINKKDKGNYIYLKYYKDNQIMIISSSLNKNLSLSIDTWFIMTNKRSIEKEYRRGLLIYNK